MQPPSHRPDRFLDPARRALIALPLAQVLAGVVGAGLLAGLAGWRQAAGFAAGAVVIALGQAVYGWRTVMRPQVVPAGRAFARLWLGSLLKWLVIGAGLATAMAVAALPAGSVLGGALVAYLASLFCLPWLLR